MRVAVLLGAGASRKAGLKTTYGLAQDLMERINSPEMRTNPGVTEALNFVYGEMAAHRGARGENPLAAVNTERLISAVRLLADRDNHEADPFVASWKTAPGVFSATATSAGADLQRALSRTNEHSRHFTGGRSVAWAVRRIASDRNDQVYRQLEQALLQAVSDSLSAHGDVGYLHPLIQVAQMQEGVDIATLNYDLTVETAARELAAPVHRGVEEWTPGSPMEFTSEKGHVNLFKLHGSIDWEHLSPEEQVDEWRKQHGYALSYPMVVGRSVRVSDDGPVDRPAIIIGDREKLNGEGPTLALIAAFERSMSSATHMVVVGYSFTDVHVNALIRSWANADDRRTISVIDPFWPARHDLEGFRSNLLEALRPLREISRFRMDVLRAGAEECLAVALDGVRERPAAPVSLHCVSTPHGNELHITNQYTGLRRLHISSPFSSPGNPNPPRTDIGDPNQQFGWAATHDAGSLDEDEVRVIRIDSEQTPGTDITFGIQASDHQDEWDYSVDVRWPGN